MIDKNLVLESNLKIKMGVLQPTEEQSIKIPIGSKILTVDFLANRIRMFFICDIKEKIMEDIKVILKTENQSVEFKDFMMYLKSFVLPDDKGGYYILHAFVQKKSTISIPSGQSMQEIINKLKGNNAIS